MKVNRNYTIEKNHVDFLATVENASGLINELLDQHIKTKNPQNNQDINLELQRMELVSNEIKNKKELLLLKILENEKKLQESEAEKQNADTKEWEKEKALINRRIQLRSEWESMSDEEQKANPYFNFVENGLSKVKE